MAQINALCADHLNGPWNICIQEAAGFVTGSSLAENFNIATQYHCAFLINKDTFNARLLVHADPDPLLAQGL